ncbi:hypothetical protein [Flavobacterium filum]|uniref:hypothetical protein n=1 Tax=Flavobacterium filum TaxID=370974 RepID=UPI0023F2AAB2|nr:hypothetical protein [Flavobacterium filum]
MPYLEFIKTINTKIVFDVKVFSNYFRTSLGQQIWKLLLNPESIKRLAYYADAGISSAEGVDDQLDFSFGKELNKLKKANFNEYEMYKKMMGRMIKEILLANGYEHVSKNCKVRKGKVFSYASKYKLIH